MASKRLAALPRTRGSTLAPMAVARTTGSGAAGAAAGEGGRREVSTRFSRRLRCTVEEI